MKDSKQITLCSLLHAIPIGSSAIASKEIGEKYTKEKDIVPAKDKLKYAAYVLFDVVKVYLWCDAISYYIG